MGSWECVIAFLRLSRELEVYRELCALVGRACVYFFSFIDMHVSPGHICGLAAASHEREANESR